MKRALQACLHMTVLLSVYGALPQREVAKRIRAARLERMNEGRL